MARGDNNATKTHCPKGHEYTPENIKRLASRPNARYCRTCARTDNRIRRERRRREAGMRIRPVWTPEDYAEYMRRWKAAHPGRVAVYNSRAREKRAKAVRYLIVPRDERRLRGACVYCGDPADSVDHVIPLVRGGTHGIGNLVPACLTCNKSKHARTVMEWRKMKGRV